MWTYDFLVDPPQKIWNPFIEKVLEWEPILRKIYEDEADSLEDI